MFTVQMQEADWIKVLNLLANYPFKQTAGIIQQIQMQLQPQLQAAQKANGVDTTPGEMRVQ